MSENIFVKTFDNNINFYSPVTSSSCAELNKQLRELDFVIQKNNLLLGTDAHINLRIHSYGGSLFAGLSTVDTIRSLKTKVYSHIDGAAASAATLISVVCDKRFIGKNSMMLVHQLSTIHAGTFEQLQDQMQNSSRLMDLIKSIYKQYTKIPMKDLNEILKKDIWFDSELCLKHSLVDEII